MGFTRRTFMVPIPHAADIDELKVSTIEVNEAPTFRRYRARAKGRGTRIIKRNSHITISVGDE